MLNTKVNGIYSPATDMVEDTKYGQTEVYMKVTGKTIRLTVVVDSYTQMVIFMTVNGKMIKHMDSENILTLMVPNMKAIGSTISSTVKEKKSGQMVHSTKETTNLARKMDLENFCGLTGLLMKETS